MTDTKEIARKVIVDALKRRPSYVTPGTGHGEDATDILAALAAAGFKVMRRSPCKETLKRAGVRRESYIVGDFGRLWDAAP